MPKRTRSKSKGPHLHLPHAILELYRFTTQDTEYRAELNVVRVEPDKEDSAVYHAVATDGHRMAHLHWFAKEKEVLEEPIHLDSGSLKAILESVSEKSMIQRQEAKYEILTHEGQLMIATPDAMVAADEDYQVLLKENKNAFPEDWRKVIPKFEGEEFRSILTYCLDYNFLKSFFKYLDVVGASTGIRILHPDNDYDITTMLQPLDLSDDLSTTAPKMDFLKLGVKDIQFILARMQPRFDEIADSHI